MMKSLLLASAFFLLPFSAFSAENYFAERTVSVSPKDGECVGRADDPMCVFDTVVACVIRNQPDLCKKVGLKYSEDMKNALSYLAGKDYKYTIVDLYMNRRKNLCEIADDKACVFNPETGKNMRVDMSLKDNRNFSVYLRREKNGNFSVSLATQFQCWSDEECS
ncbi:MAG: hypothetical protein LBH81_02530 [Rickettsiales bacterium]|jgi:hypothetical protein|nr:hypothetical protein [Rickettsiales bacterium]